MRKILLTALALIAPAAYGSGVVNRDAQAYAIEVIRDGEENAEVIEAAAGQTVTIECPEGCQVTISATGETRFLESDDVVVIENGAFQADA